MRAAGLSLPHAGLWLAALGAALQLAGLSWDVLTHRLDVGPAGHEDVLTLANPSHALFVGGLALTVAGIATELAVWRRQTESGAPSRRAAAVVAGGLLLISAGATAVGLAAGRAAESHTHPANINLPQLPALLDVLQKDGSEKALDRLDELAARDPDVLGQAHLLAHELGRASLARYGSAPVAFVHCRETFLSGCYHGVLQAYMETLPRISPAQIVPLCASVGQTDGRQIIRFQCLHGLGHGLYANLENDLPRALRFCDALGSQWERESCYGGVFMENINTAIDQRSGTAGHQTHEQSTVPAAIKSDDPLYPCSGVEERFLRSCYMLQSSVILMLNGYDFVQAFATCENAAAPMVSVCYQSMGRDISGFSRRDPGTAIQLCSLGAPSHRDQCYVGAVKDVAYESYRADEGFVFCAQLPGGSKPACYTAAGEQIYGFFTTPEGRAAECGKAEPAFVDACRRGAQAL